MQGTRDSLVALLEKRRVERQGAEQALARAVASHEAAAQTVARAEQALAAHVAKRPAAPSEVGSSDPLTGHELTRAAAFGQRHAEEAGRFKQGVLRAHAQLAALAADMLEAQHKLARASADERALEQHQARLERTEAQRLERREQEAADEDAAAQIIARKGSPL